MPQMTFTQKIKTILRNPSKFYDNIKSEKGVKKAFIYLAIISLVSLVVSTIFILLGYNQTLTLVNYFGAEFVYIIPFAFYILGLGLSFVGVGFVHLFVRLLSGKGRYAETYKALIYGSTPSALLSWVPFVGFIFGFWSIYLEIKGLSKLHQVSMLRALFMILIPGVIVLAIIFAFIFWYVYNTVLGSSLY